MQSISPHLHWTEDTCSVYLLRQGDQGLLIDCGTDLRPSHLADSPGGMVDRLLLTHFHRDQCAGFGEWQAAGAEVVIPFAERRFFEEADLLRASYDTFDNYTAYYSTSGPLSDVRGAAYAHDYARLEWGDISIDVIPLPGHTFGSVGYLFEADGQRVLACGDLLSAPGQMRDYFPLQWRYMDFQGHVNWLESLRTVAQLAPDLILPGHGQPFAFTPQAIADLQEMGERLYELFYARPFTYYRPVFRQLSPHVHEVTNSMANTYIVDDGAGHALFIDCGYTSAAPITANPHRFIDNLTPYLEAELGIHSVEWFLPSHYHDDHLAGYAALRNRYGTKMASSPELQDIIEQPERYDMPCLVPEGYRVDAVVERGEAFSWRGIDFYIEQHPGQTLYHHLIRFDVDGLRYFCIGDNISGLGFREERDFIHSFIPKNRTPVSSYTDMPRQILDAQPDILLTGHGGGVACDPVQVQRWQVWMEEWQAIFTRMLDQPHPNLGMDPRWVEFYPYKVRIQPGERVRFELRVTNHEETAQSFSARLRSVEGIQLAPEHLTAPIAPGAVAKMEVVAQFPQGFTTHSLTIVADVTWGGRRLGEIAEAIAYW
jgi:glyoxylase-like metal-dependent hydrolase (beta-lactamase superfamily II)